MIMLLAVAIVAVTSKYDQVSALAKTAAAAEAAAAKAGPRFGSGALAEGKNELFFGGEESDDLFWGFKHNWRHYFSFMHELHSGIVNDYALWGVIALALAMLYAMIIL